MNYAQHLSRDSSHRMASGTEEVRVYDADDMMTVVGLVIGMRAKSNMTTKRGSWVVGVSEQVGGDWRRNIQE